MLGLGIDIVENKRIENSYNENFINQVLTKNEIDYLNKLIGKKKLLFLCGRFALKEAIIKAISDYENPHMLEIEITNNENGKPIVIYKDYKFLVSIAHENKFTIAEAILLK